jgi:uncharacterized membrane protein YeaQ/YmgE (transglycosylase-associated protein family)
MFSCYDDRSAMVNRIWMWLSLAATVLMAASSAAGVFLPDTYARETTTWATQGVGQDMANLFCIVPAMLITLHFALRASIRATLVWLGILIYMVYSYALYAFFIHFGPWFPVYVAVLGMSAYALFGSVIHIDLENISRLLGENPKAKLVSVPLLTFGVLFAAHWLSEIVPALASGTSPKGVADIGMPVNPVHVLDLAFVLPGLIATAVSIRKRRPLGLLFAVPLLTFSAVMGVAILSMFFVEHTRGGSISAAPLVIIGAVVLVSVYGAYSFLHQITKNN